MARRLTTLAWLGVAVLLAGAAPSEDRLALLQRAEALRSDGDVDQAVALYRRGRATWPDDVPVLLEGAWALALGGDRREALAWYRAAVTLDPASAPARAGEARLLHWTRRYTESEAAWRALLEVRPRDAEALAGLTRLLVDLQRFGEAAAALRTLDTWAPGHPELAALRKLVHRAARGTLRVAGGLGLTEGAPWPAMEVSARVAAGRGVELSGFVAVEDRWYASPTRPAPALAMHGAVGWSRGSRGRVAGGPWLRLSPAGVALAGSVAASVSPVSPLTLAGFVRVGVDEGRHAEGLASVQVTGRLGAGWSLSGGVSAGLGHVARDVAGTLRLDGTAGPLRFAAHGLIGAQQLTFSDVARPVTILAGGGAELMVTVPFGAVGVQARVTGPEPVRVLVLPTLEVTLRAPRR